MTTYQKGHGVRASDHHRPPSAIDPSQIVATRSIGGRTLQVLAVGDHRYRLTDNGTILHPGIDPWVSDSPPTTRQIRAFMRPRTQAFAALMDQYTRSATAACAALAEAIGQQYLGLPIAVVDLDTGTSLAFRICVRLVRPPQPPAHPNPHDTDEQGDDR
jgi:hypothetical protein